MAIKLREGVLGRIQKSSDIKTDEAMAGAIGVSVETYRRVKNEKQNPSLRFITGLCEAFGLQLGEVAVAVHEDSPPCKAA